METLQNILKRRSVRTFSKQKIERKLLETIVDTAKFSPSWMNNQGTKYYVFDNSEKMDDFIEACKFVGDHNKNIVKGCAAIIALSSVKGSSGATAKGVYMTNKKDTWEMFDAGIAAQTFCLTAFDYGVGSVILGIFDDASVGEFCKIPQNETISALIAIGYPENYEMKDGKRKETSELLTFLD